MNLYLWGFYNIKVFANEIKDFLEIFSIFFNCFLTNSLFDKMSLCDSFSMKSPSKNTEILVKEELFTSLTVELETGRFEKIEILYNDDPMKLAEEFLIQHKIDLKIKDLLAKNIQDAKEKASKEKAKKNTSKSLIEPYPSIYYENLPYFE